MSADPSLRVDCLSLDRLALAPATQSGTSPVEECRAELRVEIEAVGQPAAGGP